MSSLPPRLSPRPLPRTRSRPQLKRPPPQQRPQVQGKTSLAPSRKPILFSSKRLSFLSHLHFKGQCKYSGRHFGRPCTLPSTPALPVSFLSLSFSPVSPSPWPMPSTPSATPPSSVGCRALGATGRKRRRLRPSATSENPSPAFFLTRRSQTCQSVPLAPLPTVFSTAVITWLTLNVNQSEIKYVCVTVLFPPSRHPISAWVKGGPLKKRPTVEWSERVTSSIEENRMYFFSPSTL